MNNEVVVEAVPIEAEANARWDKATSLLEQTAKTGAAAPELAYMLALAYKRQGKLAEARSALRKISPPDANVWLQLGLLSFKEGQYAQAENEFSNALEKEPHSYPAMFNLFLCRFVGGQMEKCLKLLSALIGMAPTIEEKRLLLLVDNLIATAAVHGDGPLPMSNESGNGIGSGNAPAQLAAMSDLEESQLLRLIQAVPNYEVVFPLMQRLAEVRWNSRQIQRAWLELVLVRGKRLVERGQWHEIDTMLAPLSRLIEANAPTADVIPLPIQIAFWNLQGCTACIMQDFDRAVRSFTAAIRLDGNNALLYQNLALAYEIKGRLDQSEAHWNRYFDLIDQRIPVPPQANYLEELAFTGLNRLSDFFTKHEKWGSSLNYLQRAHHLRPRDLDTLERLFNLYIQVRRPEDARRTLNKMRELKPGDPQFDLYELDIRDVRTLEDLDRMLADIKHILNKHPGDMRVEDRSINMVISCVPIIGRKCDQFSEQLGHIVEQVRRLPNYQINWPIVHDEMHYLRHEFQKLRRISNKCLALVSNEEQRRVIKDLNAHIDSKIDICISMGG